MQFSLPTILSTMKFNPIYVSSVGLIKRCMTRKHEILSSHKLDVHNKHLQVSYLQ